jgi:cell wall-associated NlpC family hydrolase
MPDAAGTPMPQPGPATGSFAFPMADAGPATGSFTFPMPDAGPATPASGMPMPEVALMAPAAGLPAAQLGGAAPLSGVPAPGVGYAAPVPAMPAPGLAAPMGALSQSLLTTPAQVPVPAPAPVMAPTGATVTATGAAYLGKADKALAFARAQIGRPCVWGATGPESYDCSSLTQAAWRAAGVTLPRTAIDQAKAFTRVGLDELRPGDLVFFHDDLSHVGLCTSGNTMIHAPGPGAHIREEPIVAVGEGTVRGAVRPA